MCYSADGQSVLAGGMSKFVCIYHVKEQILMKKFEISCNLSLDAMEVRGSAGCLAPAAPTPRTPRPCLHVPRPPFLSEARPLLSWWQGTVPADGQAK